MERERIARLLPDVVQRTLIPGIETPLSALLALMEELHRPVEERLGELNGYFDPYSTPAEWVYYVASWLDLDPLFTEDGQADEYAYAPGIGHLRELVVNAVQLAAIRGTSHGLRRFLEIATGLTGYRVVDDPDLPFHIIVRYPAAARDYRPVIDAIVRLEKPAYVTYVLEESPAAEQPADSADRPHEPRQPGLETAYHPRAER